MGLFDVVTSAASTLSEYSEKYNEYAEKLIEREKEHIEERDALKEAYDELEDDSVLAFTARNGNRAESEAAIAVLRERHKNED